MIRKEWFLLVVLLIIFGSALWFSSVAQTVGDQVIVLRDETGLAIQTQSHFVSVWLLPLCALLLYGLFVILSRVAVYKPHLDNFFEKFFTFRLVLLLLLFVMYLSVVMTNLGVAYQTTVVMIAVTLGFVYLAHVFHHTRSDDLAPWIRGKTKHWYDTHHLGVYLFSICAFVSAIAIFVSEWVMFLLSVATFITFVMILLYGIIIFRKEHKVR
jgi:hypothetical protein